jgi:hypothetical protein
MSGLMSRSHMTAAKMGWNLPPRREFPAETLTLTRCVMIRLALALTLLVSSVPFAVAQHAGTPQEQNACTRDASRFCRRELGNDNAVQSCLQQHRSRLSAPCRKVYESHGM